MKTRQMRFVEWKWTLGKKVSLVVAITFLAYGFFFMLFPEHVFDIHFRVKNAYALVLLDIATLSFSALLTWELNALFIQYLDKRLRWESRPLLRFFVQIKVTSILAYVIIASGMIINARLSFSVCPELLTIFSGLRTEMLEQRIFLFFLCILFIFHGVYFSGLFYRRWIISVLEAEGIKRENLHAQLHTLQNLVNPHFVFNSLNTLTAIIEDDQKVAVQYVQRLASFYRYLLQRQTEHLVLLDDELHFVESYIYLQKKRFGENMIVDIRLDEEVKKKFLPTYVLQILLENALKHNIISSAQPLKISISAKDADSIIVQNNLQRRTSIGQSTEKGLDNIRNRYHILGDENIQVLETSDSFSVTVPLFNERMYDDYSHN